MVSKIIAGGKLLGLKFKISKSGFVSFTEAHLPLQIAALAMARGKRVAPHYHRPMARATKTLGECLLVWRGLVRVRLYEPKGKLVRTLMIKAGEGFVLLAGAHSLEFLEATEAFEFKNGPFKADRVNLD